MSEPSSCRRDSCRRISELLPIDRHTLDQAQWARLHSPLRRPTQLHMSSLQPMRTFFLKTWWTSKRDDSGLGL
ncbi:hypothetical protein EVAR_42374_1 [Eumeta japonica]|uniref:Uncharacterized protein n=1 Tax=Eumeta variegata TaxID=151549 RepID=A0A4C1YFI2_EUMVA|nr:hypothetical protein EVAR_42374_1 [Eumeta japonica]